MNRLHNEKQTVGTDSTTQESVNVPTKRDTIHKIRNLWEEALKDGYFELIDEAEEFLNSIAKAENSILDKELTNFQYELWNQCYQARLQDNLQQHPFHSKSNVMMFAPTSSGKTAVAEIFLLSPFFHSKKRRRAAIYVAPTKALAQMKYKELITRYGQYIDPLTGEPLENRIIISTGEDYIYDNQLSKGKFTIACIVYEKAIILFSQRKHIFRYTGCLVIDELHMLQDIQRGPALEMLIAKALHKQHKQHSQGSEEDKLKIVGISTEGTPPEALKKLFQVIAGEILPPIEIRSQSRPVPIRHYFVLPTVHKDKPFTNLLIEEFNNTQDRIIPLKKREEIKAQIDLTWQQYRAENKKNSAEVLQRLTSLLKYLLKDKQDYRLLVFIDKKRKIQDIAEEVNAFFNTQGITPWNTVNEKEFSLIIKELELDNLENRQLPNFASYGVFLHHADVDRDIRTYIEQHFADLPDASQNLTPQVVIATQTLAYGVNLTVHDVVILAVDYPFTNRKGKLGHRRLNACAFHNMVGRAGRLGKLTSQTHANVYVVPEESGCANMVDQYYSVPPHVKSQLFRDEDSEQYRKQNILQLEEVYKTLSIDSYTYPFIRTILDSLRHLTSKRSSAKIAKYASPEDLKDFLVNTLYYREKMLEESQGFQENFDNCMRGVLWKCSEVEYQLVQRIGDEEKYAITELGESLVNTGTGLKTIASMLKCTKAFYEIWKKHYQDKKFPTLFYLLVVITQEEIFRDKVNNTTEGSVRWPPERRDRIHWNRGENRIDINRRDVASRFQKILAEALQESSKTDKLTTFVKSIILYLEQEFSESNPRNAGVVYREGVIDIILRLFCAVMTWVKMAKIREVRVHVTRTIWGQEGRLTGFRQLVDQVSWKLLFLLKLNKWYHNEKSLPDLSLEQEIELLNLASQVRHGTNVYVVTLCYPASSNFSRFQIRRMLRQGLTSTRLLSSNTQFKYVINKNTQGNKLLKDTKNLVRQNFNTLADEIAVSLNIGYDELEQQFQIRSFWEFLADSFDKSIEEFSKVRWEYQEDSSQEDSLVEKSFAKVEIVDFTNLLFDQRLRSFFNFEGLKAGLLSNNEDILAHDLNNFDIEIIHSQFSGMIWKEGVRKHEQDSQDKPNKILGVQFNNNWLVHYGDSDYVSLSELLKREAQTPHLLFVTLPWIPYLEEIPLPVVEVLEYRHQQPDFTTVFISLAAFATLSTLIACNYILGSTVMQNLRTPHTGLLRLLLTQEIPKLCRTESINSISNLPDSLHEELLKYYEVGKDYQELLMDKNEYEGDIQKNKLAIRKLLC